MLSRFLTKSHQGRSPNTDDVSPQAVANGLPVVQRASIEQDSTMLPQKEDHRRKFPRLLTKIPIPHSFHSLTKIPILHSFRVHFRRKVPPLTAGHVSSRLGTSPSFCGFCAAKYAQRALRVSGAILNTTSFSYIPLCSKFQATWPCQRQ